MSAGKKATRDKFRTDVFTRDRYTCQVCGKKWTPNDEDPDLHRINSHHISDRTTLPNGGYVKENGITVCEQPCHLKVEQFHLTGSALPGLHPDNLYAIVKSNKDLAFRKSLQLL